MDYKMYSNQSTKQINEMHRKLNIVGKRETKKRC
jgi:hypothetical protein